MKHYVFFLLLLVSTAVFAQSMSNTQTTFDLAVEGGYYPLAAPQPGMLHFAPITGPYDCAEFRIVGRFVHTVPVPFGENPLVRGNSVRFKSDFELTPVSVAIKNVVAFSPIAFLDFSLGGYIGTGWDFIGIKGLAVFDREKNEYKKLRTFVDYRYELWAEGLFQFDLAAVYPGDWNHVVAVASYTFCYKGVTGCGENKDIWKWQGTGEQVNGWNYTVMTMLGYQMPLKVNAVGIQTTWKGYCNANSFQERYNNWNPEFCEIDISPLVMLKFDERNSLVILMSVKSRRSYDVSYDKDDILFGLHAIGSEWFFNRIAFSYTHHF